MDRFPIIQMISNGFVSKCEDHVASRTLTKVFKRFVVNPFVVVAVLPTFISREDKDQWKIRWRANPRLSLATKTSMKSNEGFKTYAALRSNDHEVNGKRLSWYSSFRKTSYSLRNTFSECQAKYFAESALNARHGFPFKSSTVLWTSLFIDFRTSIFPCLLTPTYPFS